MPEPAARGFQFPLPAIHAWALLLTVLGAALWRVLPPLPPLSLAPLPLLILAPNARWSLGTWRLSVALLLVLLTLHGGGPAGRSVSPVARPDARALAEGTRALILWPLPDPAAGLAAPHDQGSAGETAAGEETRAGAPAWICGGLLLDSLGWKPLPGALELWPHDRRCPPMPADRHWLLVPKRGGSAAGAPLWETFRGPIGPFARDPGAQAWDRGRLGRMRLDSALVQVRALDATTVPGRSPVPAWCEDLRRACAARLSRGTGSGGPWLIAILLGEQRVLPAEDVAIWQRTGLAHLLAVSGLNVGVLALALWMGLSPLPVARGLKHGALALLLLLYVPLAGNQVSVRRAVLMALLLLAARRLERPRGGMAVLALAAIWMLWQDPGELARPGFQMSFGAVAALVLGLSAGGIDGSRAPQSGHAQTGLRKARGQALRWLGQALRLTLLAQTGAVLSQLACFGALPLSGVALNLAAVPLSSLLTVAGFLHLVLPLPGEPLGALCQFLAGLLTGLARAAPAWSVDWTPHPLQLAILGAVALLAILPAARARLRLTLAALLMLGAADLLPRLVRPGAALCLFDVGQGDALLLRSPGGAALLVDAGWSNPMRPDRRGQQLGEAVRRLHGPTLDWLVLTHPDQDHLGGAAGLMESCDVRSVLWNGEWKDNPPQNQLRKILTRHSLPLVEARPGQLLQLESGWRVCVLGPPPHGQCPEGNERSIVLRVDSPVGSVLLTGDAGHKEEKWLSGWGGHLKASWLKLGHHGSRGSSSEPFLDLVDAQEAWISCGRGNGYGHPHIDVLERVRARGMRLHRSDQDGWRWLSLDGGPGPRRAFPRPSLRLRPAMERAPP